MESILNNSNLYTCETCGHTEEWDDSNLWSCEKCETIICTSCIEEYNTYIKEMPISHLEIILCKDCYNK
ncbi:MAG: hypothetical protein IJ086_05705 [Clostridium sp.]|nr:hypothetical protein [Clostridium sp.]